MTVGVDRRAPSRRPTLAVPGHSTNVPLLTDGRGHDQRLGSLPWIPGTGSAAAPKSDTAIVVFLSSRLVHQSACRKWSPLCNPPVSMSAWGCFGSPFHLRTGHPQF